MPRYSLTAGIFLLIASLAGMGSPCTAVAQSPEELQTLRLFYKDKDLVVSATRHPKLISQVAENITVITEKEIEAMNAHTVAEVLSRVPGVFVDFNRDFGATSLINIQASEPRHVLVLLDGIPWNLLSEGSAETNSLPIGIVERIEIIKGPASSAWGSSLGGVINILTKAAGDTARPTGAVRTSFGEGKTRDYRAQVAGLAGRMGYYLYAGRQETEGLRNSREFAASNIFAKFNVPLPRDATLGITMGGSRPENAFGPFPSTDTRTSSDFRSSFLSASLDASLTPELDLNLTVHTIKQKLSFRTDTLGLIFSPAPQFFSENTADNRSVGAKGKLVWTKGRHTAVLGIDTDRGRLDQTVQSGPFLQAIGAPAATNAQPAITRWALYGNDTIALDRFTLTPGLRYDHNSIIGAFVSPSLGATYRLGKDTLARLSVARGFTMPPFSTTSVGGLFLNPNPNLQHESLWSYQAGLESALAGWGWVKATAFFHDLDNAIARQRIGTGPPTNNDLLVNRGGSRRQGLELEAETLPFHDFSLAAGLAYVHIKSDSDNESRDKYTYNLGLKYDDRKTMQAQLFGHYVWWDQPGSFQADYGNFIWDLNVARKIMETGPLTTGIFFTVHNLFNSDQYTFIDNKNPERWFEAGLSITF